MGTTVDPQTLSRLAQAGTIDLIDVRTPAEFETAHLAAARNVPLDRLDPQAVLASRKGAADQPIYFICQKGGRGRQACEKLEQAGFCNVVNVEGGTQAWIDAGLPVVRGKQTMSLERQVRIVAGSLVLTGVLLGRFVDLNFIWLAAFVGAGLVFAGVTDTCGMGMLLARMPWNRGAGGACATS